MSSGGSFSYITPAELTFDSCCCPTTTTPAPKNCCKCPISYDFINGTAWDVHLELQPGPFLGVPQNTLYPAAFLRSCAVQVSTGSYYYNNDYYYYYSCPSCVPLRRYCSEKYPGGKTCIELTIPECTGHPTDYTISTSPGRSYDNPVSLYEIYELMRNSFVPDGHVISHLSYKGIYWDFGQDCTNVYIHPRYAFIGYRGLVSDYYSQISQISLQKGLEGNTYFSFARWFYGSSGFYNYSYCNYEVIDDPIVYYSLYPVVYIPYAYGYHIKYDYDTFSLPAYLYLMVEVTIVCRVKMTIYTKYREEFRVVAACNSVGFMRFGARTIRYAIMDFPWNIDHSHPEANARSYSFSLPPFDEKYLIFNKWDSGCHMLEPGSGCHYPMPDEVDLFFKYDNEYANLRYDLFMPMVEQSLSSLQAKLSFDRTSDFFNIASESCYPPKYFWCADVSSDVSNKKTSRYIGDDGPCGMFPSIQY